MASENLIHIIIKLSPGGTELKLINFIKDTKENFNHTIIILTSVDKGFKEDLLLNNIKFDELRIKGIISLLSGIYNLRKRYRENQVDLIIGWLYHSNLFAILFKRVISTNAKIIWNIRSSMSSFKRAPFHRKFVIFISKFLLKFTDGICYNSEISMKEHKEYGFSHHKEACIANGVNLNKFRPINDAKEKICNELNIDDNSLVVGMCSRYHQVKNFPLLVNTICKLLDEGYMINCLLCGKGLNKENKEIISLLEKSGYKERFFLLGHRTDLPLIYSALDLHLLTSLSESSSNSVLEALSSGTMCVSTRVGTSDKLLDEKYVVESDNIEELVKVLKRIFDNEEHKTKSIEKVRNKIRNNFSIKAMNQKFIYFYKEIILER